MLQRLRQQNPLPPGAFVVAVGLALSGIATYAFFAIASRALDPVDYAAIGVLWSLLFAVGNGVMQPLEQEVARAVAHRRAQGIGAGPVIRRAALIGAGFAAGLIAVFLVLEVLAALGWIPEGLAPRALLKGEPALEAAFLVGLVGFGVAHLTRGTLSSHGRFGAYAIYFTADGIARVALAAVLAAVGVALVGWWGAVLAAAPFVGSGIALLGQHGLLSPGPQAAWGELTRALGWLLMGTVSLALIVQGGTIAVDVLASDDQAEAAGVFLNGLQIARIPLFLFQAILASLLPRLSRLAAAGQYDEFRGALRRLLVVVGAIGAIGVLVAVTVGPQIVGAVFGLATVLGADDLGLLAATYVVIMAAICFDQALIALQGHRYMAMGWAIALVTFVVVTALGDDLFRRVEIGLMSGAAVALAWMAFWLRRHLRWVDGTRSATADRDSATTLRRV